MKTQTMVIVLGLVATAFTSFGRLPQAQQASFPSDLVQITSDQVPRSCGNMYSMAYWPEWPPLPACFAQVPGYSLYYSPSMNSVFLDDRLVVTRAAMRDSSASDWIPWPPGGGDTNSYDPGVPLGQVHDWASSNGLYLTISLFTNSAIPVTLHHTTAGSSYEFLSSQSLTNPMANWASEGIWMAAATDLPVSIQQGTRTNQLFFDARVWNGMFLTNGQLFVKANTNTIYPVINGVTNTVTVPTGAWAVLNMPSDGPIYQLNLGYDASDNGYLGGWVQQRPQQDITALAGYSATLTNLCLSYNPIQPDLDVSGWPALQDLECWQCASGGGLYHVNVTNCPNLVRVCVESCGLYWSMDFTGCPKIADIRGADNTHMHGLVIPSDCKSAVWHLCIHDDTGFDDKGYDLTAFPAMRQLWAWNDGFTHSLNYPALGTPTKLESVQAFGNAMGYADFSGQTNLQLLEIYDGETLTNINISGCKRLGLVDLDNENLSEGAVDHVLTNLVLTGITSSDDLTNTAGQHLPPTVYMRANASPSQAGLAAVITLSNRGWNVYYDAPPVEPNTNCVTGTAPIWFTNTQTTLRMQVYLAANYDAVTWYLGDGTKVCGALEIDTYMPIGSSNCVVVDPPSALLAFGVAGPNCSGVGSPTTKLTSVWGLTNYPNLQQLYLYGTDLNYVSLAGCTNLTAIALTGTAPSSTNVISAWFTDLLDAQRNTTINSNKWFGCLNTDGGYFYYPATPGLNSDATAALTNLHYPIGWNFWHP